MLMPSYGCIGTRKAKVVIVGEAWGREEAQAKLPFVGYSGRELHRMLGEAWKHMDHSKLVAALKARDQRSWNTLREAWMVSNQIMMCNVVAAQPPENNFTHFLYSNDEAKKLKLEPYHGVYPKQQLEQGIKNLWTLLDDIKPELVIACGNWPLHVLTPHANVKTDRNYKLPTGIGSWRGSQTFSRISPGGNRFRVLPIIHPAAILRDWGLRHVTVHDLRSRAGRYLTGKLQWEVPPPAGTWKPFFDEVVDKLKEWRETLDSRTLWLSVDLETYQKKFITCLGAFDGKYALCIPFFFFEDNKAVDYWKIEEELEIWKLLKDILEHKNCKIIGQNFIYDTQFLLRGYGIEAIVAFDTMVAHHLAFPGTPKTLEYLASLYCGSYCYWKDESEEWSASNIKAEDLWFYNCKDVTYTMEIAGRLQKLLKDQGLDHLYENKMAAWKLARKMMIKGINYNDELRQQYRKDLYWETNELETWLLAAVPEFCRYAGSGKPWYASNQAQQFLFYHVLGIKPILHKKTKKPTLDAPALEELVHRPEVAWLEPLTTRLTELRSAVVSASHFLSVVLGPTGRLHTQFNIAHPETHRWSSKENSFGEGGNLQNLPTIED